MKQQESTVKPIIAASIGNALEWYDFGLYGYLATVLQELFFPFENQTTGLLAVFLVFAIGLFMRPFGGLIFAHIGDKYGRKASLVASMTTIAIPTFLMGFLPTFHQAGVLAIALLVLFRLFQGLAVGGEFIGSMIFLAEHSAPRKRGFSTCLIYSVGTLGGLLGSLSGAFLHALFSEQQILDGAWRIPFFLGIIVGGIGLYIRFKVEETPLYLKLKREKKTAQYPFKEAWREHKKEILIIFFLIAFQGVGFYLPFVYLSTWLIKEAHFSGESALFINSVGLFFLIILIPLFAILSDRIGRRKILMAGCLATCIGAYPLLSLLSTIASSSNSFFLASTVMLVFAIIMSLYQGPLAATLTELLSTKNRYMALIIGYNFSASVFGGLTPYTAAYLVDVTGLLQAPSFLLILTGALAFFVLLCWVKETFNRPLK